MNQILIIFALGVVAGGVLFWYRSRSRSQEPRKPWCGVPEMERQKDIRKGQLLDLFDIENKVTNNDVQKLLDVSDATATRYLQELEDEDQNTQVGAEGRSVYYVRKED